MSEATIKPLSQSRCFDGIQAVYSHAAQETRCAMRFGVFLPPQATSRRVRSTLSAAASMSFSV